MTKTTKKVRGRLATSRRRSPSTSGSRSRSRSPRKKRSRSPARHDDVILSDEELTLFQYCEAQKEEVVKAFIKLNKVNLHIHDNEGNGLLHYSCKYSRVDLLRYFLSKGCKVDMRNRKLQTPLHIAAKKFFVNGAFELLEYGAKPGLKDDNGNTACHIAAINNWGPFIESIAVMTEHQMSSLNKNGHTPLHCAVVKCHLKCAKLIVDKGDVSPDIANKKGRTSLHYAMMNISRRVKYTPWMEMLDWLVTVAGADVNAVDGDGKTPAHYALESALDPKLDERFTTRAERMQIFKWFVQEGGANPGVFGRKGVPLTCMAADYNRLDLLIWLFEQGAHPLEKGFRRWSTIHSAARSGSVDIVKWLVKVVGANINEKDGLGRTALYLACQRGLDVLPLLKFLMASANGSDNAVDPDGWKAALEFMRKTSPNKVA